MTGKKLFDASSRGDKVTVRTLLSTPRAQSFINYQNEVGCTPLYIAALKGHAPVTEQLIEARCNVDLQQKNGCTALFVAAHQGHAAILEQLIKVDCKVDLKVSFISLSHSFPPSLPPSLSLSLSLCLSRSLLSVSLFFLTHSPHSLSFFLYLSLVIYLSGCLSKYSFSRSRSRSRSLSLSLIQDEDGNTALHIAPKKGMQPSRRGSLLCDVTSNFRQRKEPLRSTSSPLKGRWPSRSCSLLRALKC